MISSSDPPNPTTSTPTGPSEDPRGRPAYLYQRKILSLNLDMSRSSRHIRPEGEEDDSPKWVSRLATMVLLRAVDDAAMPHPGKRVSQADIDEARAFLLGEFDREMFEFWCLAAHIDPRTVIKWAKWRQVGWIEGGMPHVPLIPRPSMVAPVEGDDDDTDSPDHPTAPDPVDGIYPPWAVEAFGGGRRDRRKDPLRATGPSGEGSEGVGAGDSYLAEELVEPEDLPLEGGVGVAARSAEFDGEDDPLD